MAQIAAFLGGFVTYQVGVIIANAVAKTVVGRGLTVAGNAALTRAIGVAIGPVGWIVTGVWSAVEIAGPAYRVTIPAVCHIALLRAKRSEGA